MQENNDHPVYFSKVFDFKIMHLRRGCNGQKLYPYKTKSDFHLIFSYLESKGRSEIIFRNNRNLTSTYLKPVLTCI